MISFVVYCYLSVFTAYPGEDESKRNDLLAFEHSIINLQLSVEDTFLNLANNSNPMSKYVILCDRGLFDPKSYMPVSVWNEITNNLNLDLDQLMNRYDAIIHLVTAAEGASEHYTLENNEARTETQQEAISLDHKTREVYSSHKSQVIIDNDRTFVEKMSKAAELVSQFVEKTIGLP